MASHLALLWKRGLGQLRNGLNKHIKSLLFFFPTDVDLLMEWKSAFRRGLAPNVSSSAFLATMMRGIIFVRMTEVRRACMDGME